MTINYYVQQLFKKFLPIEIAMKSFLVGLNFTPF